MVKIRKERESTIQVEQDARMVNILSLAKTSVVMTDCPLTIIKEKASDFPEQK